MRREEVEKGGVNKSQEAMMLFRITWVEVGQPKDILGTECLFYLYLHLHISIYLSIYLSTNLHTYLSIERRDIFYETIEKYCVPKLG